MKNKISSLEINILSTYLLKSCILINGVNLLLKIAKNDSIISIIIGSIIGFIFIFIYNKLDKKTTIERLDKLPVFISIFCKIILILIVAIFSSYLLYSISLFINKSFLTNMNILPISILFIICTTYLFIKGIKTICKSSFICFFIFCMLEIISILFLIPSVNSQRILPIFNSSLLSITKSSIIYIILSISPIFLLLIIPKKEIINTNKKNNIKLLYIITNLYIIFNFILLLSIIYYKFAALIDYPEVFVLSKISVLNFFDRMEGILSFKLIFDIFFTISLCMYYIYKLIISIKDNDKLHKISKIILPIFILVLSNYINYSIYLIIIILSIFLFIHIIIFLLLYLNNQTNK